MLLSATFAQSMQSKFAAGSRHMGGNAYHVDGRGYNKNEFCINYSEFH